MHRLIESPGFESIIFIADCQVVRPLLILILLIFSACNSKGYPPNEWNVAVCANQDTNFLQNGPARKASDLLQEALTLDNGSGIAAAVMRDGELIWSDAVGKGRSGGLRSDGMNHLSTQASMRIGSVSKPFTAALIGRLVDMGLVDIDLPVQDYVPEFPDKQGEITLRNLLSHSSGIRHYDFSNFSESNSRIQYRSATEPLGVFSGDPLLFPPDNDYHYSSFGYNLAGAVIESVTDLSFEQALTRYLADPMGLQGTTVDNPESLVLCRPRFSTVVFGWLRIPTIWRNHSDSYPSAGILSTAEDLVRFADAYFNGEYLNNETKRVFTQPVILPDGRILDRSLGWELMQDENGQVEWYGHGGTTNGAYASLRYYPKSNLIVAGISNYNFWLTDRTPRFFTVIRKQLPDLFQARPGYDL